MDGYELDILDYLLKPFTLERFKRTLQKFRSHTHISDQPGQKPKQPLLSPTADDFIFVRSEYKVVKVRLDELKIIEGAGNYVALHIGKTKILTLQNLKAFEEYLSPYRFVRVHKSFILSAKHIDAIENSTIIVGDKVIPIGESYRESLQKFITEISRQF